MVKLVGVSAGSGSAASSVEVMADVAGVAEEMTVEVVQWEEGLLGSRYRGVVLELKREAGGGGKRKSGAGSLPLVSKEVRSWVEGRGQPAISK